MLLSSKLKPLPSSYQKALREGKKGRMKGANVLKKRVNTQGEEKMRRDQIEKREALADHHLLPKAERDKNLESKNRGSIALAQGQLPDQDQKKESAKIVIMTNQERTRMKIVVDILKNLLRLNRKKKNPRTLTQILATRVVLQATLVVATVSNWFPQSFRRIKNEGISSYY